MSRTARPKAEVALDFEGARGRFGSELQSALRDVTAGEDLLAGMAAEHLATGGKRLRGLLPSWLAENLSGAGDEALLLGAGLELLHNATLVHDDLQDGDTVRRGAPALWTVYGAAQAINAGDALYFLGMSTLLRAKRGPTFAARASAALLQVIGGQVREFQLQLPAGEPHRLAPTLDVWVTMARGKTGALIGACLGAGAHAAGRPETEVDAATRHGEDLGLLFQVQDDLLDLVGDKGRGVSAADLREGKLSFPVVWAVAKAPSPAVERLMAIVSTPRDETTVAMVEEGLGVLHEVGAVEATIAWLRRARGQAETHALAGSLPGLADRFLAPVAHVL